MKKGIVRISVGAILIALQILSMIGNAYAGAPSPFNGDVFYMLGYFLVGIIGVITLVCGLIAFFGNTAEEKNETPKHDIVVNRKASNALAKFSSFVVSKKKVILALIIVGIVLNLASLFAYVSLDKYMEKLYRHYDETEVFSAIFKRYEYGCGMTSCPYCKGNIIRSYNESYLGPYQIEKYSFISDTQMFFELSCVLTISITIVCSTLLICAIIYQRKTTNKEAVKCTVTI